VSQKKNRTFAFFGGNFSIFFQKSPNMGDQLRAFPKPESHCPDSGKGLVYYSKNRKFSTFLRKTNFLGFSGVRIRLRVFPKSENHYLILIQGQGRVFTVWECAQSIPRP
jgi:hypothetical protein